MRKVASKLPTEHRHLLPARAMNAAALNSEVAVTHIQARVYHSRAAWNFSGGYPISAGVWCRFEPVHVRPGRTLSFIGQGMRYLVQKVDRLDRKRVLCLFEKIVEDLKEKRGTPWEVLQTLLLRNCLELT